MNHIGIIGAGAWGTALGMAAQWAGAEVLFWDRDASVIDQIANTHMTNVPLQGLKLHPSLRATHSLEDLSQSDMILLVTAAQAIPEVANKLAQFLKPKIPIVLCSKGIQQDTGKLLTDRIKSALPHNPLAVLSGPAFAIEVAQSLPTAVSLAAENIEMARKLSQALTSKLFRVYPSNDIIGVQLGGAFKNVLAIASGIVNGMKLGQNAQASLVTRGLAELSALGEALGAKTETFMGLSGLGDIILTCTSLTSRNMKFGTLLGEGHSMQEIKKIHNKLAEGVFTTKAVMVLSKKLDIDLPICKCVNQILYENFDVKSAFEDLLSRPIRDERRA